MTTSSWIVRAILRAWPSDLRNRHGRALAQTFTQSWDDVHGAAAMWHRTALVADALTAGLQQRRRQTPRRHWSMTMRSMSSTVRSARRALAARPLATALCWTLSYLPPTRFKGQ